MRVLSYNIRSLRDDRAAVVEVIRAADPDLVCLQEVPRFGAWRTARAELARRCGLRVVAGRRVGGLAVLAASSLLDGDGRVAATRYRLLTVLPGLHVRAVAIAVFEISGARLVVASSHLDLHPGARLWHAAQLRAHLAAASSRWRAPAILGIDVNEDPAAPAWRLLASGHAVPGTAPTYPTRAPARRIDALFTTPALTPHPIPISTLVPAPTLTRATDHLPILAEVTVPRRSSPCAPVTGK